MANNRARGVLFTTPKKIVCEGNFFDHVSGAAILLAGDAQGWYESGACENVVWRRNRVSRHDRYQGWGKPAFQTQGCENMALPCLAKGAGPCGRLRTPASAPLRGAFGGGYVASRPALRIAGAILRRISGAATRTRAAPLLAHRFAAPSAGDMRHEEDPLPTLLRED